MCKDRHEIKVNEILGITKDHELYVIEDVFQYGEVGLHGATHHLMSVIDQDYVDERLNEPDEEMWKIAVQDGYTTDGLDEWWERECSGAECYGQLFPYDDNSFRHETERLIEEISDEKRKLIEEHIGEVKEGVAYWNCESCGRIGDDFSRDNFLVIFNEDLFNLVQVAENEGFDVCTECGGIIPPNHLWHGDNEEDFLCEECYFNYIESKQENK